MNYKKVNEPATVIIAAVLKAVRLAFSRANRSTQLIFFTEDATGHTEALPCRGLAIVRCHDFVQRSAGFNLAYSDTANQTPNHEAVVTMGKFSCR